MGGLAGRPQPPRVSCKVETTGLNVLGHWPTVRRHKAFLCFSWEKDPQVLPRLVQIQMPSKCIKPTTGLKSLKHSIQPFLLSSLMAALCTDPPSSAQFEQSGLDALQPNGKSSSEAICTGRSRDQLVLASSFTTKASKGAALPRGEEPAGGGEAACVSSDTGAVGKVSRLAFWDASSATLSPILARPLHSKLP